ncbi:MAG: hypothetical protein ACN4GZ_02695 [Acidimicrobiales bacterium]
MGFFDSIKKWFSSEAAEVKESATAAKSRMESEMDRREAELHATPEQKLEQIQSEITDDPFAELRGKIEGQQAHADAVEELAQTGEETVQEAAEGTDSATAHDPENPSRS